MSQLGQEQDIEQFSLDPVYQNQLATIEEAFVDIGAADPARSELPTMFDDKLRALIDAVPLVGD